MCAILKTRYRLFGVESSEGLYRTRQLLLMRVPGFIGTQNLLVSLTMTVSTAAAPCSVMEAALVTPSLRTASRPGVRPGNRVELGDTDKSTGRGLLG